MTHRATITLDKEAYSFLLSTAKDNRSAFINELLIKEKQWQLEKAILQANQEELSDWDETLADGI